MPAPVSDTISTALSRLQTAANHDPAGIWSDPARRTELLRLSRDLTAILEEPADVLSRVALSPCRYAFLRLAIDLNLFQQLATAAPTALAAKQLAKLCGAEEDLVRRITRTLVSIGFVDAAADGGFVANDVTRHMLLPNAKAGMKMYFDQMLPVLIHAPAFFQQNGYRSPSSEAEGMFQWVYQTSEDAYTFWSKQPGVMENFNAFAQGGYFGTSADFVTQGDWFPVDKVCLDGYDEQHGPYSLVDVGGNKGYQLRDVLSKHPDAKGRFILQDLPQVIQDIDDSGEKLPSVIEKMGYDFFTPQPVKGARAYMLNSILHNWSNSECHRILTSVRDAMTPGYSKLLIGGVILPEKDISPMMAGLDAWMLMGHAGGERDATQWMRLVEDAGLRVVKFWYPPGAGNGVVEAELK